MQMSSDTDQNLDHAREMVRQLAQSGAEIVCLPELFRSPYFPREGNTSHFELAEPIQGPSTEALSRLAAELQVVLIVPIFEKREAGLYHNTAVVIDADGQVAHTYRKMHIPDDPYFYEKFYFAPGDLGFHAADCRAGRIATLICWDQWFPEAARLVALDGAQMLFYPTAIGWIDGEDDDENAAQRESWLTVQRAHAIANGVFVIAVNRVGQEENLNFFGSSFVCDPQGRILEQAAADKEQALIVEIDLNRIQEMRQGWPFLRDRRIDAYADLDKRFRR